MDDEMLDVERLRGWAGRSEQAHDEIAAAPLRGLAATLEYEAPVRGDAVPPLGHWLYFFPQAPQK